jgi:toxin FitB
VSYLLDTNVISELRKPAGRASTNVRVWAGRQRTSDLLISVITVMEIEIGIARLERGDTVQGNVLRKWLERDLLAAFATRILPVDLAVVRRACAMHVPDPRPERDVLIAATALSLNLVVVTRNIADFQPLGVELLNPWDK